MFAETHSHALSAATIAKTHPRHLDELARSLWKSHGAGLIDDDGAQHLAELIEARRKPATPAPRRVRQARPASVQRRRQLAASGPLPPNLAVNFTTGELAVLRIVGDEFAEHGFCDRSLGEIAARAGVGRTTAQGAIREAGRLGLLDITERRLTATRSDTNVLRVVSKEWLMWLARGPGGRVRKDDDHGHHYILRAENRASVPLKTGSQNNFASAKVRFFEKSFSDQQAKPLKIP